MHKKISFALLFVFLGFFLGCGGSSSSGDAEIQGNQFDRIGIAGVNTVFIPSALKDSYNTTDPSTDVADHGQTVVQTTEALRAAVGSVEGFPPEDLGLSAEAVRGIVNPDVVALDLSATDGFPNGRKLDDDVIDTALQVTLNRSVVSDGVSNDSQFLTTFPYLGNPN